MMKYTLEITELEREDGGGYLIQYPELKYCFSDGNTIEEALINGNKALIEVLKAKKIIPDTNLPNTRNLRSILERIWSGELPFDQKSYGSKNKISSPRCLAAWDCTLRGVKMNYRGNSRKFNNLNYSESALLFLPESTKELQELVLIALENGKRLDLEEGVVGVKSEDYNSQEWKVQYVNPEEKQQIKIFLDISNEKYFTKTY